MVCSSGRGSESEHHCHKNKVSVYDIKLLKLYWFLLFLFYTLDIKLFKLHWILLYFVLILDIKLLKLYWILLYFFIILDIKLLKLYWIYCIFLLYCACSLSRNRITVPIELLFDEKDKRIEVDEPKALVSYVFTFSSYKFHYLFI